MNSDPGWTWEATAMIIQAVATVVALIGVAITFAFPWRAEKRERLRTAVEAERADASAERAERAAALSIDTLARIADAVEKVAASGPNTLMSTEPPRVKWRLAHFQSDAYLLTNIGGRAAYDVSVSADPTLRLYDPDRKQGPVEQEGSLGPGDVARFLAVATYGTRDTTITVRWRDELDAEDLREWRYPLPPRKRAE